MIKLFEYPEDPEVTVDLFFYSIKSMIIIIIKRQNFEINFIALV